MSYDEYIKDLDHEDLKNLIERCERKLKTIEESGKVSLYLVSCDCFNHFASPSEEEAVNWLKSLITLLLQENKLDDIRELSVHEKRIFKSELPNWKGFNTPPEECVLYKH